MPPTVAVEDEEEEAPRWPLASSSSEASLAPHPTVRTREEDEEATSQTPEVSYYYVAGTASLFSPPFPGILYRTVSRSPVAASALC